MVSKQKYAQTQTIAELTPESHQNSSHAHFCAPALWEPAAQEQHAAHIHAEAAHGTALTTADGSGRLHSQAAAVQIIAPLHIATGV